MRYEVCYIDDHILPYGEFNDADKITLDEFTGLLKGDYEWAEDKVKETIELNLNNAARFKQIDFYGFTNPEFFLKYKERNGINPDTLIMDWDFGTKYAPDYLGEIIDSTKLENIFILSGNATTLDIKAEITPFEDAPGVTFDIFEKSSFEDEDLKTQLKIVPAYNKSFFSRSEKIQFNNTEFDFHPSSFIPIPEDLWMLESIIGNDLFMLEFGKLENVISHKTIEEVVDNSSVNFYMSKNKKRIYTESGLSYAKYFGEYDELESIKPIYAIKNFELFQLEQAVNSTYVSVLKNER